MGGGTERMRIVPDEMRAAASDMGRLSDEARQVQEILQRSWRRLDYGWQSYARENVDSYYRDSVQELHRVKLVLEQITLALRNTVDWIEAADQESAGLFEEDSAWATLLSSPHIKGVAQAMQQGPNVILTSAVVPTTGALSPDLTIEELVEYYQDISWKAKFDEEERIEREIAKLEQLIPEDLRSLSPQEVDEKLQELKEKIEELERKRSKAQENADKFVNKVLPDWSLESDGEDGVPWRALLVGGLVTQLESDGEDGVPWRVKADDYEDEIAEYDRKLSDLEEVRDNLNNQRSNLEQLRVLRTQQRALNEVINAGIPPDGPTENGLRNYLSGCTNYVAEKRNVQPWPNPPGRPGHPKNAKYWSQQAMDAGYEVGDRPVKGAIMVMNSDKLPHEVYKGKDYAYWTDAGSEPKHQRVHGSAGHVAYVEEVTQVERDGRVLYEVEISEANIVYDSGGNFVKGTHTPEESRTFLFDPSTVEEGTAEEGVDFIYELPKGDVQTV
jgi:WXG100 family type VII secretion target